MKFLPAKLFFLFFATCHLLLFPAPAHAYTSSGNLQDFQKTLADQSKYNKESFDFQSIAGTMSGLATILIGCTIDETGPDQKPDGKIEYNKCPESFRVGAIPVMGVAIAGTMSSPPASGFQYLADIGQRLQLVKPAYAQTGFGFGAVQPFLPAWRAVRNLTYLFFVLAAIGFGVSIMLRRRISPQAVITIQSTLPKIIVALVLVTFSYAIIGLLIDLIYVTFAILVWGLNSFGLTVYDPANEFNYFRNASFTDAIGFVMSRGIGGAADIIAGTQPISTGLITGGMAGIAGAIWAIAQAIAAASATLAGAVPTAVGIGLATVPMIIGLALTVIYFLFRILFALARAYLLLLIHLIFAPILILYGTVGNSGVWNTWMRGTLANLLVFPFVGAITFLTTILMTLIGNAGTAWGPPFIGNNIYVMRGMISLGAIMLIPTIPDVINQMLGVRAGLPMQLPGVQQQIQTVIQNLTGIGQRLIK